MKRTGASTSAVNAMLEEARAQLDETNAPPPKKKLKKKSKKKKKKKKKAAVVVDIVDEKEEGCRVCGVDDRHDEMLLCDGEWAHDACWSVYSRAQGKSSLHHPPNLTFLSLSLLQAAVTVSSTQAALSSRSHRAIATGGAERAYMSVATRL